MSDNRRNKTLFAASVFSAALTGALGEMEEYFDDRYYAPKQAHQEKDAKDQHLGH